MGKQTGFLEFDRLNNPTIGPEQRTRNFLEFHSPMDISTRQNQAARCMNCGVPFCQSGCVFGGMVSGCPLHNLIPEWNDEIYNGNWHEALLRLIKTNNFPEFTGRVCPALCEAACTCGMNGEAVTVHDNELSIIEEGYARGWMQPRIPHVRSEKRVAVIGSGPSGLAVADQLNQRGHTVVVYERKKRPGGLLMYGIPNMKLDKRIVNRRINLMEEEGITFQTGMDIGADICADEIRKDFDAVVICCGAKAPRDLKVEGRDAKGVYFAVDFLSCATEKVVGDVKSFSVSAKGKNVVVVGGGDTGNDCVGTCIRQGCSSITQLEMLQRPPESRSTSNPWPQWPRILKTDYGQQEAISVFGKDPRIFQTTISEIVKDENGNITAVKTVKLRPEKDVSSGRIHMVQVAKSEEILPCELLLIAAGFVGCEDYVATAFGLEKSQRGTLLTAEDTYATGVPGIFTAGDARRGQSLVVWAIAEGRACAKEVDRFLMDYSNMV